MTRKVLVSGGAGFIGSHVVDAYLAAGDDVTVLDDLSTGKREHVPPGARFVQADVRSPAARELLAKGGFTLLNHHAAQMDVRRSVADPLFDADVNVLGLLNLLEGARRGGVQRVVFASSGGTVYGETARLPVVESAPKLPASPYGTAKLASEYYLATFSQLYGLETVALRYGNVYGPRQNPHGEAGVVAIFAHRVLAGQPLTVFGDGNQTRDMVFVQDVVDTNLAASRGALPPVDGIDGRAFNIGTGSYRRAARPSSSPPSSSCSPSSPGISSSSSGGSSAGCVGRPTVSWPRSSARRGSTTPTTPLCGCLPRPTTGSCARALISSPS